MPLAAEKTFFPAVVMEFLSITIDTSLLEFRLPVSKLDKIRSLIVVFLRRKKSSLRTCRLCCAFWPLHAG